MSESGTPTRGRDAGVTVRSAATGVVDGRSARRDRNRIAVLDAAIELFAEGNLQPSPGEVAARCGVSHRSINRYFPDGRMMLRAAVDRQVEVGVPLYRLHSIGRGPLAGRIDDFVQVRLAGHAALGATARAATLLAATSRIVRSELAVVRDLMSDQVERQFAPELDALAGEGRAATQLAVEALFQFESLDYYLQQRELTVEEARRLLMVALTRLLDRG